MTLAELVEDVMARLAEESNAYFAEDAIKRWLNEGERTVVRQTRILQDVLETGVAAGVAEYQLPPRLWQVRLVELDGDVLRPIDLEAMRRIGGSGRPTHYAIWRNSLWLHPKPASAWPVLRVFFYAWPKGMVNDDDEPEIPEAFHGLLVTWAAYRAKQADQDMPAAQMLYQEFQRGVFELQAAYAEDQAQGTLVREIWVPEGWWD